MASSSSDSSRRNFIRSVAAGSVVAVSSGIGHSLAVPTPAFGDAQLLPASSLDFQQLERWAAGGRDWKLLREHFLLDLHITYLNTGSVGACPRLVVAEHARQLYEIERSPTQLVFGDGVRQMEEVRRLAASFLGASLDEIMLTANTTTGMNMVGDGLSLEGGDEVLTSNHEHPGGQVCWAHQSARRGVVIREINLSQPFTGEAEIVSAVTAAITARTKVISLSHVSTINGLRLPVAAISQLARERGIFFIVDGAQSAGMLDINLHEMGCDAFATSGHKWLLAPKGSGILYLRKDAQAKLSSVYARGGLQAYTAESGTRNVPQILAQGMALQFLNAIGRKHIEEQALFLARRLRRELQVVPGVEVLSPAAPELQSAIVSIQLPPASPGQPVRTGAAVSDQLLKRHHIVTKVVPGEHLAGRGLRLSTHLYNSERDIERFVQALRETLTL